MAASLGGATAPAFAYPRASCVRFARRRRWQHVMCVQPGPLTLAPSHSVRPVLCGKSCRFLPGTVRAVSMSSLSGLTFTAPRLTLAQATASVSSSSPGRRLARATCCAASRPFSLAPRTSGFASWRACTTHARPASLAASARRRLFLCRRQALTPAVYRLTWTSSGTPDAPAPARRYSCS